MVQVRDDVYYYMQKSASIESKSTKDLEIVQSRIYILIVGTQYIIMLCIDFELIFSNSIPKHLLHVK